jgi:hypothetical protein
MGIEEVFKTLSKGVMVSLNSSKYLEIAKFLNIDENFDECALLMDKLGFNLKGENGYFFLSKKERMSENELNSFIHHHKAIFLAIAILKQLFPLIDKGHILKQTDFIVNYNQKNDPSIQQKLEYIFETNDLKNITEQFLNYWKKILLSKKKSLIAKMHLLSLMP